MARVYSLGAGRYVIIWLQSKAECKLYPTQVCRWTQWELSLLKYCGQEMGWGWHTEIEVPSRYTHRICLPLWQTIIPVLSKNNILCGCHHTTERHYSVYLCNSSRSWNPSGNPFSWSWVQSIKMKENDVNVFILILIYQTEEKPSISSLFVSWESW